MNVMHEILNEGLVDASGDRCGRVDDVEVEDTFDRPPRIVAVIVGNGAKSRLLGRWPHRASLWIHRALGMKPPIEPVVIPWSKARIEEAHIRLSGSAHELGLDRLNRAVADRFIRRIPGAGS